MLDILYAIVVEVLYSQLRRDLLVISLVLAKESRGPWKKQLSIFTSFIAASAR